MADKGRGHPESGHPESGHPAGGERHDAPEDELRVPRSEEDLEAQTHEREAGRVRVRKSVHTDREQFRVPRKREEVGIERVAVEGEAREVPGGEIGEEEDEVVVQVFEEEVVVSKRVVLKEEIRVRKEVVEEEEVVEEDVRREEVEIVDDTDRGIGGGEEQ